MRIGRTFAVALLSVCTVLVTPMTGHASRAVRAPSVRTPAPEIDTADADEYSVDGAPGMLVWAQGVGDASDPSDAYVRFGDADPTRVDAPGVEVGFVGTDGTTIVLSEVHPDGGRDLALFDAATLERLPVPAGVNTAQNEDWPSIDGDRLIFLRTPGPADRTDPGASPGHIRAILIDLSTGEKRVLSSMPAKDSQVFVGQVEGDFAAWSTCYTDWRTFTVNDCQVFRYRISTDTTERVPNPRFQQFAPMVTADGTLYFSRNVRESHWVCGSKVRIMRYGLDGSLERIASVPEGFGDFWGHAVVETDGSTTLHMYRPACEDFTGGIYRLDHADTL